MGAASRRVARSAGGEAAELLGEPGVAAPPVGEDRSAAGVGQRDHDLAAVGLVRAALDVAVGLEAVDRAGHRRRLDALGAGQVADGLVAQADEQPQDDHLADAQVVVGVPLGSTRRRRRRMTPARSSEASPASVRRSAVGMVVSITHYLC